MRFLQLVTFVGIASCAIAGYHDPPSSYSFLVKHEEPHYSSDQYHGGDAVADHHGHDQGHHIDYYAYPKYTYNYAVDDSHTGDNKKQWETRDGDFVKGGYMLHEPDGTTRIVEYTSDKHHGFNAIVKKIGHPHHHPQTYGGNHGYDHSHGHDHHASSYQNIERH